MSTLQLSIKQHRTHQLFVLASPILVVILGHFGARLFHYLYGDWAWLGSSLV